MVFGEILRKKRQEKGLSQDEVAVKLGVNKQNVSGYETGYKIPPVRVLEAAADLFGCTTDEMLGRCGR